MARMILVAAVLLGLVASAGCVRPGEKPIENADRPKSAVGPFENIDLPSAPGAGQPHVIADPRGGFLMCWTEPAGEMHAIRMARFDGSQWSDPSTIGVRDDFFVNWADFPSIAVSGNVIYAHWLQRSAPGTYNYDVVMSISTDGGLTWGHPFVIHDDGVAAEHGFASMLPLPDSRVGITWLDGREMAAGHGEGQGDMSLRYAVVDPDGAITEQALLDSRTCECCTTTIVATPEGPLVAWRDRSADEIRDISTARLVNGSWTEPSSLHADGWHIEGCPVNGPQSDVLDDRVVIAWFTSASDEGVVNVSFSGDGGATFEAPLILASGGGVVGYVDVLFVSDDRAFVVWMVDGEDRLDLVGRLVGDSGEQGDVTVLASTSRGRTGFPRMAKSGSEILLAWNEKGESPGIRAARAVISQETRKR